MCVSTRVQRLLQPGSLWKKKAKYSCRNSCFSQALLRSKATSTPAIRITTIAMTPIVMPTAVPADIVSLFSPVEEDEDLVLRVISSIEAFKFSMAPLWMSASAKNFITVLKMILTYYFHLSMQPDVILCSIQNVRSPWLDQGELSTLNRWRHGFSRSSKRDRQPVGWLRSGSGVYVLFIYFFCCMID